MEQFNEKAYRRDLGWNSFLVFLGSVAIGVATGLMFESAGSDSTTSLIVGGLTGLLTLPGVLNLAAGPDATKKHGV